LKSGSEIGVGGRSGSANFGGKLLEGIIGKIRGEILEKTRGNFGTTPISRSKIKMYAKLKVYR
jgi:hypothetical protein